MDLERSTEWMEYGLGEVYRMVRAWTWRGLQNGWNMDLERSAEWVGHGLGEVHRMGRTWTWRGTQNGWNMDLKRSPCFRLGYWFYTEAKERNVLVRERAACSTGAAGWAE